MQIVYHAANSADAQLVRGLLAQEGIESFLVDGSMRVEVVDDDAGRARNIIAQWQTTAAPLTKNESDEPSRPDVGGQDRVEPAEDPNLYKPLKQDKPAGGFSISSMVLALIVGAVMGAFLLETVAHSGHRRQPSPRPTQTVETDTNGDGETDQWTLYVKGQPTLMRSDRNGDGKIDQVVRYKKGVAHTAAQDNDFDGYHETQYSYRGNEIFDFSIDRDGDGKPDYRGHGEYGLAQLEEWLDPQGRIIKQVRHTALRTLDGKYDSDGDGTLDVERIYDERGEIASSRPLSQR